MRRFYVAAAVIGTLVPWLFFGSFFALNGLDINAFILGLFANGAAAGFSADVLISMVVFWVWSWQDAQRQSLQHWWLVLPAGFTVGLSLALPLYLWMREDA
ncbi:DUF2834 domain-containing protein [Parasedimentitalea huanghaiensis]|uniref:DUF2834 domain-containing protein n=1 Tax=Parasedimentitalea huanghaiensis TaxID=2682100 RepID=A0A6L6WCQ5_9RHOB|nr:DUF2834 domain-containing protein [Zongyanglinia huanghaiensis]MVO15018.1 DUF2834 domain-containing protein [Zongyanglinia huanghaiensis]